VSEGATVRRTTDVWMFNPADVESRANVKVTETSGRTTEQNLLIAPRATAILRDVAGSATSSVAQVVVTPRGELVVSARTHDGSGGSAVPVLAATAGLRLGQGQVFSGLEDSESTKTGYGLVETSGADVSVRARLIIDTSSSVYSAATERTLTIPAGGQLYLPELLRSFAGGGEIPVKDVHGLVLELQVIGGNGSVVPFLISTDSTSNDPSIVVQ
jgi:hypothetical protein